MGGSYALTAHQVRALHFGFTTDFSPVGDQDEYFSMVDLYGATVGVSGTVGGLTAALGVNYQFGSANDVPLADILDSDIPIIYSLAYRFQAATRAAGARSAPAEPPEHLGLDGG